MVSLYERFLLERYPQLAEMYFEEPPPLEVLLARMGIGGGGVSRRTLARVRQAQRRRHYSGFLSRRAEERREREVERRLDLAREDYGRDC